MGGVVAYPSRSTVAGCLTRASAPLWCISCSIVGIEIVDWSANGWTIVGLVISVLGAAFSGGVYWNRDNFKRRLKDEPAIRFDAAKALTAPKPWDMYLGALEGALDTLTSWMGERARLVPKGGSRGAWGKSANWCFVLAMIYPFVFLLTSWLFGGTGTIGEVEFLPPPEAFSALWRAFLVLLFLAYGAGMFFLFRNLDRIDEIANAWLDRHLWQRFPERHRSRAKVALPLGIGISIFGILYIGLGLPLAGAVALAGALALAGAGALALAGALAGA